MYLTLRKTKNGDDFYVYTAETIRIAGTGKTKVNILRSFGRKSKLDAERPGFVERLEKHYEKLKERSALIKEQTITSDIVETEQETYSRQNINVDYMVDDVANPLLSYALMPLRKIWDDDFKLSYKIDYLQKKHEDKSKTSNAPEYSINEIAFYLAASRLVDPSSISKAISTRNRYITNWSNSFTIIDSYRCLDFLHDFKEDLVDHLNKRFESVVPQRNYRMVFYDATNFYYETPLTDEEKVYLDPKGVAENYAILAPYFNDKGQLEIDKIPEEIYQSLKNKIFLRNRGVSKELRSDLPIVSVVLMIDEYGLPIDFEVYSGNTSEYKSMPEAIASLKSRYNITNNVVVADRGLNSAANLIMLLELGYGFIVAQKFSSITKKVKEDHQLLDIDTYTIDKDANGKETYRYKCVDNYVKTGSSSDTPITCKLLITWSSSRAKRDRLQLEEDKKRAEDAVNSKRKIFKKSCAWQRLVTTSDKGGDGARAYKLNNKQIEKREAECGFAAFVYHEVPGEKEKLNEKEIIGSYHSLVEIESCFRLLKYNLELRPAFVYKPIHVRAHVLLCYISLCLFKILSMRIKQLGIHPTPDQIQEALNDAFVLAQRVNEQDQGVIFHKTRLNSPSLSISESGGKSRTVLTGKDLSNYLIEHPECVTTNINHIMKACGLKPLPPSSTRLTLSKCLGRRFTKLSDMIAPEKIEELEKVFGS